jgi:ribosomal protein L7/L12
VSYSHDNVIDKLLKLNERIAVVVDDVDDEGREKDLIWCQRLLTDVKDSGLVPSKEEFIMSNLMWHKYGVLPTERKLTEENMWKLVDSMLTQENPSKIGAIKMYRRFIDSTLKEAKEMVDAREKSISQGWHNVTVVKPNRSNS